MNEPSGCSVRFTEPVLKKTGTIGFYSCGPFNFLFLIKPWREKVAVSSGSRVELLFEVFKLWKRIVEIHGYVLRTTELSVRRQVWWYWEKRG